MNKIYLLLSLFIYSVSCNEQLKTDTPKNTLSSIPPHKISILPQGIDSLNPNQSLYGPTVITRNIIQDKSGDIWLASYEGIINYDGKFFTNYTKKAGLKGHRIFSILEAKNGNLWFGSIGEGVYKYDNGIFTNFKKEDGLGSNSIEGIIEDEKGNIWFGTSGGVNCYDALPAGRQGKSFRNFKMEDGYSGNDIHTIIEDKTGRIWIGTSKGVFFYDPNSTADGEAVFTHFPDQGGLPFINVRSIIEKNNGDILIGGQAGLTIYNGETLEKILTDFIGFLYEDRKGNLWISAGKGDNPFSMTLYRYTENFSFPLIKGVNFDLIKKGAGLIFGITEDNEGNIWFGTLEGICKYDGSTFNYFEKK